MPSTKPEQPRDRRFQLRATASDESVIKIAAERLGVSVSDFIVRAARERAESSLADQTRFTLNEEQWRLFMEALDKPAKTKPRLKRLFTEKHVASRRS